jgi:WD40 repeat protein
MLALTNDDILSAISIKIGGRMHVMNQKIIPTILVAVIVILLLPGMACNSLSARESESETVVEEPILVEEPEVIEEPESDHAPLFRPDQVFRIDFEDTVYSVAYANDGNRIATGSFMRTDVWNTIDGTHQVSLEELPHSVMGLAFTPDDHAVYTALGVGGVNLYVLKGGELLTDFHGGFDNNLALSPDGTRIATGNRDGETWIWDTSTGELITMMNPAIHIDGYSEYLTSLAYSPDGSIIAAGHWNGYIFLWDANSGKLIRIIEPETDYCAAWGVTFSPDGRYLTVGGHRQEWDDVIKVYQVSDGNLAWVLEQVGRTAAMVSPVAFSPDGTLLAAGAMDGIYIWALPEFELLHTFAINNTGSADWVTDLAFSPNSQFLLAGYWDDYAILWQVQE